MTIYELTIRTSDGKLTTVRATEPIKISHRAGSDTLTYLYFHGGNGSEIHRREYEEPEQTEAE